MDAETRAPGGAIVREGHAGPRPPAAPDLAPLGALVGAWERLSERERAVVRSLVHGVADELHRATQMVAELRAEGRL